jgi:hypothetical protein
MNNCVAVIHKKFDGGKDREEVFYEKRVKNLSVYATERR